MYEVSIGAGSNYEISGTKVRALESAYAESGFVLCEVLEDYGSYKKGDKAELNIEFMR